MKSYCKYPKAQKYLACDTQAITQKIINDVTSGLYEKQIL